MTLTEMLAALDGKATLTAEDALTVRRVIFTDDTQVSRAEADALFKLNGDAGAISAEWRSLFAEAMADYVVHQQDPSGYIGDAAADWLIALVSARPVVREDEADMLVHVLEAADESPARLADFILEVVKTQVLSKLSQERLLERQDVERLRRLIFSAGGDTSVGVSRHEAEALIDINDALDDASVDPSWKDLFVQGVANAVLFAPLWKPDVQTERKEEAWLEDTSIHPFQRIAAAFGRRAIASGKTGADIAEGLRNVIHRDFVDHTLDRRELEDEAKEAAAEAVTAEEAHWLLDRIGRKGALGANEQALLAFINSNAKTIDPSLERLTSPVP